MSKNLTTGAAQGGLLHCRTRRRPFLWRPSRNPRRARIDLQGKVALSPAAPGTRTGPRANFR